MAGARHRVGRVLDSFAGGEGEGDEEVFVDQVIAGYFTGSLLDHMSQAS